MNISILKRLVNLLAAVSLAAFAVTESVAAAIAVLFFSAVALGIMIGEKAQ